MTNQTEQIKSNTLKRVITGFIMGTITLACFSAGGIFLLGLLGIFILAGATELVKILRYKELSPSLPIIVINCILLLTIFYFKRLDLFPALFTFSVISSFLAVLFRGTQPYISNISINVFCVVYSALPCFLILVRNFDTKRYTLNTDLVSFNSGFYFLWLIFFVVLFTDVFAYFVGKKFGKHKLAPVVSPKKTIEGSVAGTAGAVLVSVFIGWLINLPYYHSIILGLLITTFAQLGDLCESLIKRDAGVKDSGNALAGHGGFLDRSDSYTLSIPVAYLYIYFFILYNDWIPCLLSPLKGLFNAL